MLKLQKCWTYLFHSVMKWNQNAIILNQTKTYVFSVKICWLSYLRITLTELWAVVVALYGFCQGGENKRYVLGIAPTTIHTTYMVHYFHFENGERTCKWNHLSCWPQALFLWDNRMATLLLSWACLPLLFSLSEMLFCFALVRKNAWLGPNFSYWSDSLYT